MQEKDTFQDNNSNKSSLYNKNNNKINSRPTSEKTKNNLENLLNNNKYISNTNEIDTPLNNNNNNYYNNNNLLRKNYYKNYKNIYNNNNDLKRNDNYITPNGNNIKSYEENNKPINDLKNELRVFQPIPNQYYNNEQKDNNDGNRNDNNININNNNNYQSGNFYNNNEFNNNNNNIYNEEEINPLFVNNNNNYNNNNQNNYNYYNKNTNQFQSKYNFNNENIKNINNNNFNKFNNNQNNFNNINNFRTHSKNTLNPFSKSKTIQVLINPTLPQNSDNRDNINNNISDFNVNDNDNYYNDDVDDLKYVSFNQNLKNFFFQIILVLIGSGIILSFVYFSATEAQQINMFSFIAQIESRGWLIFSLISFGMFIFYLFLLNKNEKDYFNKIAENDFNLLIERFKNNNNDENFVGVFIQQFVKENCERYGMSEEKYEKNVLTIIRKLIENYNNNNNIRNDDGENIIESNVLISSQIQKIWNKKNQQ